MFTGSSKHCPRAAWQIQGYLQEESTIGDLDGMLPWDFDTLIGPIITESVVKLSKCLTSWSRVDQNNPAINFEYFEPTRNFSSSQLITAKNKTTWTESQYIYIYYIKFIVLRGYSPCYTLQTIGWGEGDQPKQASNQAWEGTYKSHAGSASPPH